MNFHLGRIVLGALICVPTISFAQSEMWKLAVVTKGIGNLSCTDVVQPFDTDLEDEVKWVEGFWSGLAYASIASGSNFRDTSSSEFGGENVDANIYSYCLTTKKATLSDAALYLYFQLPMKQ